MSRPYEPSAMAGTALAFLAESQMVLAEVMELSELTDHPVTRLRRIQSLVHELRDDQFEQCGLDPHDGAVVAQEAE